MEFQPNSFVYGQYAQMPMYIQQAPSQQQKSAVVINNDPSFLHPIDTANAAELYFTPSTPPLSISGSTVNSPPSHSVLPTPVSTAGGVFEFSFDAPVKPDLHLNHIAASADWTTFASPPLTPIYSGAIPPYQLYNTQFVPAVSVVPALPALPAPQHVSPAELTVLCPSLSPSPSPLSRSVVSSDDIIDADFCDPRKLVAVAVEPASQGPTLCAGDNGEHKLILQESFAVAAAPAVVAVPVPVAASPAPTSAGYELSPNLSLFELDVVEEDLYSSFTSSLYAPNKRPRAEEDISEAELDHELELFAEFDSVAVPVVVAPATIEAPPPMKKARKSSGGSRKSKKAAAVSAAPADESVVASNGAAPAAAAAAAASPVPDQSGTTDADAAGEPASQEESSEASEESASSSDGQSGTPVVRRGRKQSLTEDPSKTFVCDLCNRRFRRQEHLKRHYRSLHTHDKPFSCGECGKKFSRSDNLAQHARTHGAGSVVMGILEDGAIPAGESGQKMTEVEQLGNTLFEQAQVVANSSTSSSSGSSSPPESVTDKNRKRKREE